MREASQATAVKSQAAARRWTEVPAAASVVLVGAAPPSHAVLGQLAASSRGAGLDALARRFDALGAWLADDLAALESALSDTGALRDTLARRAAHHLLAQPGKRIRPLCVLLAARVGGAQDLQLRASAVRHLAVGAELAHAATLMHDDVIDLGDERRGASTARVLFGNPASVLGGDHLLVAALRHVDRARQPQALSELIGVIDEMVAAEALQIERRLVTNPGDAAEAERAWRAVAAGKTGALFAWALRSGGRIGGLDDADVARLGRFGMLLGEAFQLADDALDLDGDPAVTGKDALLDVREGKPTWPIAVALARDPTLALALHELAARPKDAVGVVVSVALADRIRATGAVQATWQRAAEVAAEAVTLLDNLPPNDATAALAAVVKAAARRDR